MRDSMIAALAALLCATAGAHAQPAPARRSQPVTSAQTAQAVAPAARAELVRLDAVVTDAAGRPVRDLTGADFELLEDGKPQKISHFLFVTARGAAAGTKATAASAAGTAPAAAAETAAPPPVGRNIVIVVDDLHIAANNLVATKQALARFVAEQVRPEDRVALVATGSPGGVRQLTADRGALTKAIDDLRSREAFVGAARGTQLTPAQAEMLLRGDRTALKLAAWSLIAEPGSVFDNSPRAAIESPGGGAAAGAAAVAADSKERAAEREAQRQAEQILGEATRFSAAALSVVADVVRSLAELPGRKLCLLVSDGFLIGKTTRSDQTRAMQAVVDAATRSGAVVYSLDSRGLSLSGGDASVAGAAVPPGLQQDVDRKSTQLFRETLSELAGDTGGFLVYGTNEPGPGLARMLADNEAYYLLAYEPQNTKRDGRFRRIQLRLPGHRAFAVRTRSGYFAPDDRRPTETAAPRGAAAPSLLEADARNALEAAVPASGAPVRLTVDYLDLPPAGPQAIVRAHVDLAGLRWRQAEGRYKADLDVVGGVYDAAGAPVGPPFVRHLALDLAPAEHERARHQGLQYQQRVPAAPGRFEVRLVVLDANRAPVAGAREALEVPDLGDKKLALSSVFLSSSEEGAGAAAAGATEAAPAEGLHDAQVLRRFKRGESLYFQLYVYNARVDADGASDAVLQAQIRSSDKKLVAASKPLPLVFRQQNGVPLPQSNGMSLDGFEPGRYELRVVVVDRKANATSFRNVDFTVE